MNQTESLLNQFDEELKELAIECLKAGIRSDKVIRFTPEEIQPGHTANNAERLGQEIVDVLTMIERLVRFGIISHPDVIAAIREKTEKIIFFMQLSKDLGTYQGDIPNA